jgi:photosystem II stability/assembly factor-like uncharacterized protein
LYYLYMSRLVHVGACVGCVGLLAIQACSDRAAALDSGPIWPDAILDLLPHPDTRPPDAKVIGPHEGGTDGPASAWTVATVGSEDLHDVACASGHVFVAGNKGTMLHRDGSSPPGATFVAQNVPTTADLYTVTFGSLAYGATAGKSDMIWDTKDAGSTWGIAYQCSAFVFDTFHALHLSAADAGFGVGIATNNAGAGYKYYAGLSWVCGPSPYPGEVFYDVFRLGSSGWIVGDTGGKIYRTEDQGTNWVSVSSGTTNTLRGVYFFGGAGLAVGDGGTILRSTDGKGAVWSAVTSPVTADLWDVYTKDSLEAWAVGAAGTLLLTVDGGKTWQVRPSPTTARLEAICFTSAQEGWAVGEGGTVIYTTTGGI